MSKRPPPLPPWGGAEREPSARHRAAFAPHMDRKPGFVEHWLLWLIDGDYRRSKTQ